MTDVNVRIQIKAHAHNNVPLTAEERDALENKLIDSYSEFITRIDDEQLLQEACDRGEV